MLGLFLSLVALYARWHFRVVTVVFLFCRCCVRAAQHRTMYNLVKEESSNMWDQAGDSKERKLARVGKRGSQSQLKLAVSLGSAGGAGGAGGRAPSKWPAGNLQLWLDIKMCIFAVGEATELFFSLYSNQTKQFITEDHFLALTGACACARGLWLRLLCAGVPVPAAASIARASDAERLVRASRSQPPVCLRTSSCSARCRPCSRFV